MGSSSRQTIEKQKTKLGPELCCVVEAAGDLLIQITQTLVTIPFKSLHSLSGATTLLNNDVMPVCLPGIYDDCTQAMSSVICCFVGQCIKFHTKIGNMRSYKNSNELHGIAPSINSGTLDTLCTLYTTVFESWTQLDLDRSQDG